MEPEAVNEPSGPPLSRRALLRTVGMASVTLAACGGQAVRSAAAASTTSGGAAPARALAFEGRKLGGGTIAGTDYRGRGLALWFWAPT
jgi:hypothetical protein